VAFLGRMTKNQDFQDPTELLTEQDKKEILEEAKNYDKMVDHLAETSKEFEAIEIIGILRDEISAMDKFDLWLDLARELLDMTNSYLPSPNYYNMGLTESNKHVSEFKYFRDIMMEVDKGDYDKTKVPANLENHYGHGYWYNGKYDRAPTKPTQELLKDMSRQANHVQIQFSTRAVLKIYYMMVALPKIEWSAYLAYKEQLPNYDVLVRKKMNDKKETLTIMVDDLIIIPQKTGGAHVEGMEIEYPEFMTFEQKYRKDGYRTTGRIHSHNSMGSFHSATDKNEFNKNFQIGQKFFSLVVSNKVVKYKDLELDKVPRTWDNVSDLFYNKFNFDVIVGIPHTTKEIKLGITVDSKLNDLAHELDDWKQELIRANSFVKTYQSMMNTIKATEQVFALLSLLVKQEALDDREVIEMRKMMFGDKIIFNTITQITKVIKVSLEAKLKAETEYTKLKTQVEGLGKFIGLQPPKKPVVTTTKASVVTTPKVTPNVTTETKTLKEIVTGKVKEEKAKAKVEEKRKAKAQKTTKKEITELENDSDLKGIINGQRSILVPQPKEEFWDVYSNGNMFDVNKEDGEITLQWNNVIYPVDAFATSTIDDLHKNYTYRRYPNIYKAIIITYACYKCKDVKALIINTIQPNRPYVQKCSFKACNYYSVFKFIE